MTYINSQFGRDIADMSPKMLVRLLALPNLRLPDGGQFNGPGPSLDWPRGRLDRAENLGATIRKNNLLQNHGGRSNVSIHGQGRSLRIGLDEGPDDRQVLRNVIGSRIVGGRVSEMAHVAQRPEQNEITTDLSRQPNTSRTLGDQSVQPGVRRTRIPVPDLVPGQSLQSS